MTATIVQGGPEPSTRLRSFAFSSKPPFAFELIAAEREEGIMVLWFRLLVAASLAAAVAASSAAHAQTSAANAQTSPPQTSLQKRAKHPAPAGRQITVHPRPSYLTLGGAASVGSHNGYALDTFNQPPPIEGTFTGLHGRERIQDQFGNPGPGLTLFRF